MVAATSPTRLEMSYDDGTTIAFEGQALRRWYAAYLEGQQARALLQQISGQKAEDAVAQRRPSIGDDAPLTLYQVMNEDV